MCIFTKYVNVVLCMNNEPLSCLYFVYAIVYVCQLRLEH